MAIKILMVCLGNICRSPLAEGILKSKLPKDQFIVDSAGTGDWHVGQLPDKRSIAIAKKYGIDITDQRAQHFTVKHFEKFDYIYAMDLSNYKNILQLAPNSEGKAKVKLILNELFPNENVEVPDPYYGGEEGFENVYQMLDKACEIIAKKIK
ncbi:low molecular weight protein-tyrosine-phosphatase [Flavobacterium sp. 9AF]|uniref:low molecular weight protein-tyrosine-phosphatase n=1 Tax=Flavobacterium sp. 9AF TaxID=2653142 RepID=UPI00135ACBD9|nr:low molecular weight protein-tyrosine-phosphatase [Flavobacterium sp. 9AF]